MEENNNSEISDNLLGQSSNTHEFGDYCKIRIINTLTGEECGISLNDFIQNVAASLHVTFPQLATL
jgi:hypothetical protein